MSDSPKKEQLFHYTTHTALQGIVESRGIRATHAYYLDDACEIRLAVTYMMKLVAAKMHAHEIVKFKSFLFEFGELLRALKNSAPYIFVFSLSRYKNRLSQWRAYVKQGSGVSIGFDKNDLIRLAAQNELELVKCIYNRKRQESLLVTLIDQALHDFSNQFSEMPDDFVVTQAELSDFFHGRTELLLKVFCIIKSPTFREESEWRLVSKYYEDHTDVDIQFRSGATTLIPYIEIDLNGSRDDGYLFSQVFPGPSPNFDLSFQAISAFLSNKDACPEMVNPKSAWAQLR